MRILIVAPKFVSRFGEYYNYPVGLAYISSVLKLNGFDVECLNLNHHNPAPKEAVIQHMQEQKVDVLCTGGLSVHYTHVKQILDAARSINPNIITIVGGGLVSSEPELLMNLLGTDFGILGEGEETIIELMNSIKRDFANYSKIAGLIFRKNGNLIKNEKRPPIINIDELPFPDHQGFELKTYLSIQAPNDAYYMQVCDKPREAPIIGSRSCPFSCSFCYHPLGNKYRQRSLSNIFSEIDMLIKVYDINIVTFYDELFSLDSERLQAFCAEIKKRKIQWQVQLRVDGVDRETLSLMKDAGCYYISYGIESAHDGVLKSMRKNTTLNDITKALKVTKEAGIGIQGNFIFGDRAETQKSADHTLSWWRKHLDYQINITMLETYPGTKLYAEACEKETIKDKAAFIQNGCSEIVNHTVMSANEFKVMRDKIYVARQTEHFFPGKIIKLHATEIDINKGQLYEMVATCPHCHTDVTYARLHHNQTIHYNSAKWWKLACRSCNQQFDVDSIHASRLSELFACFPGNQLAIWGGGMHAKKTIRLFNISPTQIRYIITSSDNHTDSELSDFEPIVLSNIHDLKNFSLRGIVNFTGYVDDKLVTYYSELKESESEIKVLEI